MTLQISDIARYEQWHEEMVQAENGAWVSYDDHLAALSATREQAVRECAERIARHASRNTIYDKSRKDAAHDLLSLIERGSK